MLMALMALMVTLVAPLVRADAALAQPPAVAAPAASPSTQPPAVAAPVAAPPAAEPYTYQALGRRDPFVSALGMGGEPRLTSKRGEGPAGMLTAEISVRGTMQNAGVYIALVQGPDNRTYIVRAGDKLLDWNSENGDSARLDRRPGCPRSAVAREDAGDSQAAAIVRGRQTMTVTKGVALAPQIAGDIVAEASLTQGDAASEQSLATARVRLKAITSRVDSRGTSLVVEASASPRPMS